MLIAKDVIEEKITGDSPDPDDPDDISSAKTPLEVKYADRIRAAEKLRTSNQISAAEREYRSICAEFGKNENLKPMYRAQSYFALCNILAEQSRFDECESQCRQLAWLVPNDMVNGLIAGAETSYGNYVKAGNFVFALPHALLLEELSVRQYGNLSPHVSMSEAQVAEVLIGLNQFDAATARTRDADKRLRVFDNALHSKNESIVSPELKATVDRVVKSEGGKVAASRGLALTYVQLASLFHDLNLTEESQACNKSCIEHVAAKEGDESQRMEHLSIIGLAMMHHYEYENARVLLVEALKLAEKHNDTQVRLSCLLGLAEIFNDRLDFATGVQYGKQAVSLMRNMDAGSKSLPVAIHQLAEAMFVQTVYMDDSRDKEIKEILAEAEKLEREAIVLVEKQVGASDKVLLRYLSTLASILSSENRRDEASKILGRELVIARTHYGYTGKEYGTVLAAIAVKYIVDEKLEDARKCAEAAAAIFKLTNATQEAEANLTTLALLDKKEGKLESYRKRLLESFASSERHIAKSLPGLSFADTCSFLSRAYQTRRSEMVNLCFFDDSKLNAYCHLAGAKGLLIESLRLKTTFGRSRSAEVAKLQEQLKHAQKSLSDAYFRTPATSNNAQQERTLRQLTANKEQLERAIAARARFEVGSESQLRLDFTKLQKALGAESCLIDYYLYRTDEQNELHYVAIVVTARSISAVDLGSAERINKQIENWLDCVADTARLALGRTVSVVKTNHDSGITDESEARKALESSLIEPLKTLVGSNSANIWMSPDSELARVPLTYLAIDSAIDAKQILEVNSPREFLNLTGDSKPTILTKMLLVGGINFQDADAPDLPGTVEEVAAIEKSALAAGLLVNTLTTDKATKALVLADLKDASLAHFATHGFFAPTQPTISSNQDRAWRLAQIDSDKKTLERNPLVESGILLSKTIDSLNENRIDSGRLTAEELVGLDLSGCKLVTLSACQSGLGRSYTGQGVVGLRSALMGAGAKNVLISLWSVDDEATRRLMQEFYQNVLDKRMPMATALRTAQDTIKSIDRWSAPKYWAGWTLVGLGLVK
ncbi:CHAT domain-containing protein [Candidatus Obscuribacterales bacterium]|nr:CHAT domain-containing protein [Candidatus Obscuribacterales bacterium]